jgi:S-adenosylmethionine hydrolase
MLDTSQKKARPTGFRSRFGYTFLFGGGPMRSRISLAVVAVAAALCLGACSQPGAPTAAQAALARPTIVFMTDFGTANDAVAICRAVIYSIAPEVRVTDITHQVTPFSIEEASRFLYGVTPYYPAGTVFLVVVDPGVGTSRKAIAVKSKKGQYFILPDNGVITPVLDRDGLESAREITNQHWMIEAPLSSTFHGRDIFSPAAAHLAAGWEFNLVGPPVQQLVRLSVKSSVMSEKGIEGEIIGLDDPFGSLITNIPGEDLKQLGYNLGDKVFVQINKKVVALPYARTFMDVPVGESLLYIDSRDRVGIAVNHDSYSRKFGIGPPAKIFVPRKGTPLGRR